MSAIVCMAAAAPWVSMYDPYEVSINVNMGPSKEHLFGTDILGRDVLSRLTWGSRASLNFGILAACLSGFIGTFLGATSGYHGGLIDDLLSRFSEIFLMLPTFFLIIITVSFFGSNY